MYYNKRLQTLSSKDINLTQVSTRKTLKKKDDTYYEFYVLVIGEVKNFEYHLLHEFYYKDVKEYFNDHSEIQKKFITDGDIFI